MRLHTAIGMAMVFSSPVAAQDGNRVSGNETYVIVAPIADEAKALPIAEKHCAKYGRIPHFQRMEGFRAVFDCVPRTRP
jgi:hypothetical protein